MSTVVVGGGAAASALGASEPGRSAVFYAGTVRTTWRLFGPRQRELSLGIFYKLLQAVCTGIPVVVVVWVVEEIRLDTLTAAGSWTALAIAGAALIGQFVTGYLANRHAWVSTFEAIGEARIRTLRHLQRLPIGSVLSRKSGDVSAALTSDFEMVSNFAHHALPMLFGAVGLPVSIVVMLLFIDVPMALAVLASILLAVPTFVVANRIFAAQALARGDLLAAANSRVVEYVQGIGVARAYNQTGAKLTSFRDAIAAIRAVNDQLAVRLVPLAMLAIGLVQLGIPIVVAAAAYRWFGGSIDTGTVIVFLVLVLRVYAPLIQVATQVEALRLADASLRRIGRIMDLDEQVTPHLATTAPTSYEVELDGVTFGYDDATPVLADITMRSAPSTMTALVGPSGSGKSTVLNLIARFWDPQHGIVRIGGVDVRDLTSEQLFEAVSVVFQDVYLFQGTIRDNIAFGRPEASDDAVERAARAAQAHHFIVDLADGYDTAVGEGGATLSGGERQRISIARAILKDSPIVLLDEPTASMDPLNEQALQQALSALVEHKTLVVVAHRLSTIQSADQIVVLAAPGDQPGRIVERGTHRELLGAGGRYALLWRERERAERWRIGTSLDQGAT